MSYILDAIAKSENDRRLQEVPGAHTLVLPVDSAQRPRRVISYLVLGTLLLNAILLVIWTQSDESLFNWFQPSGIDAVERFTEQAFAPDNTSATNQTTPVDVATTVASSDATARPDNSASKLAAVNIFPGKLAADAGKSVLTSDSNTGVKNAIPAESRAIEIDPAGESDLTPPRLVAETSNGEDTARLQVGPETLADENHPAELANRAPDTRDDGQQLPREISRLSDLPVDVRRDFPSVSFSGHLYSSNPKSSYVFVDDGRPVIQGQQIVDEVFLHEITPTGVIVEFRGYLIDVAILRNWTPN